MTVNSPAQTKPFFPRGYLSLSSAVERFGAALLPEKMAEIRAQMPLAVAKAKEMVPDNDDRNIGILYAVTVCISAFGAMNFSQTRARELTGEIAGEFRRHLFDGDLPAYVKTANGQIVGVPRNVWGFDTAYTYFETGRVTWRVTSKTTSTQVGGLALIRIEELERFIAEQQAGKAQTIDGTANEVREALISHETEAGRIMAELVKTEAHLTKKMARRLIEQRMGREIGKRPFERVWASYAPENWRKSGAPRKSARESSH